MAHIFETTVDVRSYELDSFGHVNHAVYLNYFEYARFQALAQGGFPYARMETLGWGVYVVRIEVDYLREARMDQRLRVRTWVDGHKRSSLVLAQELVLDEDPPTTLARARVTAVWVGPNRRPLRVPDEVRSALGVED
ncbi:MAG TPA: thioesterase family protein [Longimicrobiales bacterium]|nr:thioesterase family protein [Longimicrobiales bacterium]